MQKERKSGSGASTRKKCVYFDLLRFLETISKKTKNSMEDESTADVSELEPEQEEHEFDTPTATIESGKKQGGSRRRTRNEEDDLLTTLKEKMAMEIEEKSVGQDEDKLFLMSLLSEIKQVPPQRKLKLRSDIISAIAAAQQGTSPQWPVTVPTPTHNFPHMFPPQQYPSPSQQYQNLHQQYQNPPQQYQNPQQQQNPQQYQPLHITAPSLTTLQPPRNQQGSNLSSSEESTPIVSPSFSQMSDYVTYD